MKKTLNVNIGSVGFIIDEDAYYTLNGYYDDIRSRLYESEKNDIMDDVEARTADILNEQLSFPNRVVTLDMVKRTIATIGNANTFGEKRYDNADDYDGRVENNTRKLYRSRKDNMLAGVCGGLAQYLGIDSTIIRILMFILIIMGSIGVWIYIILWIIIPYQPIDSKYFNHQSRRKL